MPDYDNLSKVIVEHGLGVVHGIDIVTLKRQAKLSKKCLELAGVPMVVELGMDATFLIDDPSVEPLTFNFLGAGFPLPLKVVSPSHLDRIVKSNYPKATQLYTFAATSPTTSKLKPIVVAAFGSDDRFDRTWLLRRWRIIVAVFRKIGVEVRAFGGDGCSKQLLAMTTLMQMPALYYERRWQDVVKDSRSLESVKLACQDPIHCFQKIICRLRLPWVLWLGKASVHRQILLDLVKEGLIQRSSVETTDRMKVKLGLNIATEPVISRLLKGNVDEIGMGLILRQARRIITAYPDETASMTQRMEAIWTALFFFRLWDLVLDEYISTAGASIGHSSAENIEKFKRGALPKISLKNSKKSDHFLTPNAMQCVENLAFHLLVANFQALAKGETTRPYTWGSQVCECLFSTLRTIRGRGTDLTRLAILDALSRMNQVNFISLMGHSGLDVSVPHPRFKKREVDGSKAKVTTSIQPITADEVFASLSRAHHQAIEEIKLVGAEVSPEMRRQSEIPRFKNQGVPDEKQFSLEEEEKLEQQMMDPQAARPEEEKKDQMMDPQAARPQEEKKDQMQPGDKNAKAEDDDEYYAAEEDLQRKEHDPPGRDFATYKSLQPTDAEKAEGQQYEMNGLGFKKKDAPDAKTRHYADIIKRARGGDKSGAPASKDRLKRVQRQQDRSQPDVEVHDVTLSDEIRVGRFVAVKYTGGRFWFGMVASMAGKRNCPFQYCQRGDENVKIHVRWIDEKSGDFAEGPDGWKDNSEVAMASILCGITLPNERNWKDINDRVQHLVQERDKQEQDEEIKRVSQKRKVVEEASRDVVQRVPITTKRGRPATVLGNHAE